MLLRRAYNAIAMNTPIITQLRYGKAYVPLTVPAGTRILTGRPIEPLANPRDAMVHALRNPTASAPLSEIVRAKKPRTVAITISDITRPVPNELILTALLAELNAAGVRDEQVVIIIATGMHRPSTPAERDIMMGKAIQSRCEVIDHEADDLSSVVRVSDDPPVSVNARFVNADLKIVTGLIEPHFMAGYSGGRKGVCPGLVDLKTVQRFHGYQVMGDPSSVEGMLEGNPCHDIAIRVARLVGVDFLVNVTITHSRATAGIYAGDMVEAHLAGCRDVAAWCSDEIDEPYDLVVTNAGGFPLDANFYQTVKGMVTALPALHDRSTLVMLSACTEVGSPEYTATMLRYANDWRRFLRDIAADRTTHKDQWQYQMHARVLARIGVDNLRLINDGLPIDTQRKLSVTPVEGDGNAATRLQRFVDAYISQNPAARIAVIPEGPYTMLKATQPVGA
jgi:nickel-dependent lactate racemase